MHYTAVQLEDHSCRPAAATAARAAAAAARAVARAAGVAAQPAGRLAAPFRTVEFDIMYGEGISKTGELLDLGVAAGIVDKSGAWISYNGQRIGQGRENAKTFLREHPEIANEIEAAIRQNAGLVGDQMLDQSIAETPEAATPDSPESPEELTLPDNG